MTSAQRRILGNARDVAREHDGLCVQGPAVRAADKLAALGLLSFEGWGQMEDDPVQDAERRIYAITPAGRALLEAGP